MGLFWDKIDLKNSKFKSLVGLKKHLNSFQKLYKNTTSKKFIMVFHIKIEYVTLLYDTLNLKGHQNCTNNSKYMALVMNLDYQPF